MNGELLELLSNSPEIVAALVALDNRRRLRWLRSRMEGSTEG